MWFFQKEIERLRDSKSVVDPPSLSAYSVVPVSSIEWVRLIAITSSSWSNYLLSLSLSLYIYICIHIYRYIYSQLYCTHYKQLQFDHIVRLTKIILGTWRPIWPNSTVWLPNWVPPLISALGRILLRVTSWVLGCLGIFFF